MGNKGEQRNLDVNKLVLEILLLGYVKRKTTVSFIEKGELSKLFIKYFPSLNYKIILVNSFTIGSLFKFKDSVPLVSRSSVVYQYECSACQSKYVGSTHRTLGSRMSEHRGRSLRTDALLRGSLTKFGIFSGILSVTYLKSQFNRERKRKWKKYVIHFVGNLSRILKLSLFLF